MRSTIRYQSKLLFRRSYKPRAALRIQQSTNPSILLRMKTNTPLLQHSTTPVPTVRIFASAQSWIEGEAVRQLYATAKLDCVSRAVGFPDLHPGKGTPVGAAFVTEGVIYPHLIGGDLRFGM